MPEGRSAVFIDGANLHSTSRALGFEVDFKRLLAEFERRGPLLRIYYYTMVMVAATLYRSNLCSIGSNTMASRFARSRSASMMMAKAVVGLSAILQSISPSMRWRSRGTSRVSIYFPAIAIFAFSLKRCSDEAFL